MRHSAGRSGKAPGENGIGDLATCVRTRDDAVGTVVEPDEETRPRAGAVCRECPLIGGAPLAQVTGFGDDDPGRVETARLDDRAFESTGDETIAAHEGAGVGNLGVRNGGDEPNAPDYLYADRGSLVSLAEYSSVGSLMGSLTRGSLFVEGQIAKMMYWGLHKQHQVALSGWLKTVLITLSEWLDRTHRPRIKLY